jgi:hypothetical protein
VRKIRCFSRKILYRYWAFEHAADQRKQLWVVYLDFANAFNSVDHESLWRWLRESNVSGVDLLRSLYDKSYYVADLPYRQSVPIPLTRGTKQGDKLSPHLESYTPGLWRYVLVRNGTYRYVRLYSTYQYVLFGIFVWRYIPVRTSTYQ